MVKLCRYSNFVDDFTSSCPRFSHTFSDHDDCVSIYIYSTNISMISQSCIYLFVLPSVFPLFFHKLYHFMMRVNQ